MMGLPSHLYCIYNNFSSYSVSFSSMSSLKMIGMGPVHLVYPLFHFVLAIMLVVSVAEDHFPAQNLEFIS